MRPNLHRRCWRLHATDWWNRCHKRRGRVWSISSHLTIHGLTVCCYCVCIAYHDVFFHLFALLLHRKTIDAGSSVVVIPGGLAEAILSSSTEAGILLKPRFTLLRCCCTPFPSHTVVCGVVRRGFIKLAITQGRPLVPMYGFGETQLFDQVQNLQQTQPMAIALLVSLPSI